MSPGEERAPERRWRGASVRPGVIPASCSSERSGLLGVSAQNRRLIPALAGLIRASSKQKVASQGRFSQAQRHRGGRHSSRPAGRPSPDTNRHKVPATRASPVSASRTPAGYPGPAGDRRLVGSPESCPRPGPLAPASRPSVLSQQPGRGAGRAGKAEAARYSCRCELPACYVLRPIMPPTLRADLSPPPSLIP